MTRIQVRRGTAAQWTAVNPVLTAGEPGFETDTGKAKIGTGASAWNALPYVTDSDDPSVIAALATKVTRDELVINVLDHGAVGDGTTDDTAAIQSAINIIQAAGAGTLYFPPLVYKVTSLDVQAGLTILGYGATLFRPAATPNWTRTITNQNRKYAGAADSTKPIVVRGLRIDGNLANQGAYAAYELEQAALMFFNGTAATAGKEWVILEDVQTTGSVSDGVHIVENVRADIRNHHATDCFRGGLVCTGGYSRVDVDGFLGDGSVIGAHFDVEVDTPGYGSSYGLDLTIRNSQFTAGYSSSTKPCQVAAWGNGRVVLDNVVVGSGFWASGGGGAAGAFGAGTLRVRDCRINTFQATDRNAVRNPVDVEFTRCQFISNNTTGSAQAVQALNVNYNLAGTWPAGLCRLRFVDCHWTTGTVIGGDTHTALYHEADTTALDNETTVEGGTVASGYETGYRLLSGGRLNIRNKPRIASTFGIRVTSNAGSGRHVELNVGEVDVASTCTTYLWSENSAATNTVRHQGTVLDESVNNLGSTSGLSLNTYLGSRTILVTAAPTTATDGLVGDVARLKTPVSGSVYQWVCTASSHTSTTWVTLATSGGAVPVPADVQVFTATGANTWTKPVGAVSVSVTVIGGGSGGGSGRQGAAGTVRAGGGGGGGGAHSTAWFPASVLGGTETVTVGAGGAGGTAAAAIDTNGTAGTAGGLSSFGAWTRTVAAVGGGGGTNAAGVSGAGGTGTFPGGAGAAASTTGLVGVAASAAANGAAGGGSGGGLTTGNASSAGGTGGFLSSITRSPGTAGVVDGNGGNGGNATANIASPGVGGGGGGSSLTTVGGTGGNGGTYGGGGGGGGASVNGQSSGAGGAGANGIAVVVTYFT